MSFFAYEVAHRLHNNQLICLCNVINWEKLGISIGDLGRSGYGPKGYSPVKMLKALILQAWHNLSDAQLEEALRVRLDFMIVTDFIEDVPDETTICRFRNLLIHRNLMNGLFEQVNQQLAAAGFHVKSSQGAILDATIITSAARPRKELDTIVTDRQEDNVACTPSAMNLSKDPDARWLKKGCRSYFGYKGFVVTDSQAGYIQHVYVTPAHTSEVKTLPEIVAAHPIQGRLYADKGYASSDNDTILAALNIKNGIMKKAAKERPLRWSQRCFNKLISHVRYKVEQCFGTLKRRFNCGRASYMGLEKVTGQLIIKAIAYNLLKAIRASGKMALNISSAT